MTQDEADEAYDEGEELIEIVHTDEGTSIRIEDVTGLELAALIVIGLAVVSAAFVWWKARRKKAGHHYSLDADRGRRNSRLP